MRENLSVKENSTEQEISEGINSARAGDISRLLEWLKRGGNPNVYDAHGWTPLLWASARGHADTVDFLLYNRIVHADIEMVHRDSKALPIHMAGHSGSIETSKILLEHQPNHLNAVWDLNGHTILLQAVFYGHLELAKFLLKRGANTSITTARGLGPMELAAQFQNQAMINAVKPFDSTPEAKALYYKTYLKKIAPVIREDQLAAQKLSDQLVEVIENGIKNAAKDPGAVQATLDEVKNLIEIKKADVNRLGGLLQQPPLIVTVTGNNGQPANPDVSRLRNHLAKYLLEKGADPTLHEKHPMGAQTIIRAAVFNHLEILKMCAKKLTPAKLADAINEIPVVNGLTAMHDTVLRATMAGPDRIQGYLDQARWFVENGGRIDIEDFSGMTQRKIAENCKNPDVRKKLLNALGA